MSVMLMALALAQVHAKRPAAAPAKAPAARPASVVPAMPSLPASWSFHENKDAAQGPVFSSVATRSAGGYRLVVRCDKTGDQVVSVQFLPPVEPGGAPDKFVTVIPETGPALILPWEFPGAGALNRSSNLYAILNVIAGSKHLRIATTNSAGEPISDAFEGPGSDAPFKAIYADCGQTYGPPAPPAAPIKGNTTP